MLNFFASKVDDGYGGYIYLPTGGGYVAIAVLLIALLVGINLITRSKSKRTLNTKQLAFASLAIALATVTSYIKIMNFAFGGSVTLFSMLFITLVGYWFGARIGIMSAVGYGLIQLFIDPYVIGLPQLVIDYIFAFGALGISGFFSKKKHGIILGYLAGILGRYFFACLSGYIFFGSYAPEGTNPLIYSITYNAGYIFPEALITIIILLAPAVRAGLANVQKMANSY